MIEDLVLSVAGVVISFALIPQVVSGFRTKTGPVHLATSLSYGLSLSAMSLAYASLELWYTTGITVVSAAFWFILAFQRISYGKSSSRS